MIITKENIFEEAKKGNLDVLEHPNVSLSLDTLYFLRTPLHFLAWEGKIEVLNHKDVSVVKDMSGWTPLHFLARNGEVGVLNHEDMSVVKDISGRTPLHYLSMWKKVPRKCIKDNFPWFKLGKRKITEELITEILETNNACKFIWGLK